MRSGMQKQKTERNGKRDDLARWNDGHHVRGMGSGRQGIFPGALA
jgi:hypothetical protein